MVLLLLTVTDVLTTCAVVIFRVKVTLILKMTTTQVVKTSVTVNNNSPIQDYVHPDDQTQPTFVNNSWFQTFHRMYLIKTDEHEMTPSKKVVQQNCPFNFANIFVSPLYLLISLSFTSWADSCVVKIKIFSFGKILTWNWLDLQHWKALPEKNMLSKALYSQRNPILRKNIIHYRWKINEAIHPHF